MKTMLKLIAISALALSFTGCASIMQSADKAVESQRISASDFYAANAGYWHQTGTVQIMRIQGMQLVPMEGATPEQAVFEINVPAAPMQPIQYQAAQGVASKIMDGLQKIAPWYFGYRIADQALAIRSQRVAIEGAGRAAISAPILPAAVPVAAP